MKYKKNMRESDDVYEFEVKERNPLDLSHWYKQLLQLPEEKRQQLAEKALLAVKKVKPDTYDFIKKFKCELVGITPEIKYCLIDSSLGETDCTWIHAYSGPTLLYWHPIGKFGFFVNAELNFNDSILNHIEGNKKDDLIKGFTG